MTAGVIYTTSHNTRLKMLWRRKWENWRDMRRNSWTKRGGGVWWRTIVSSIWRLKKRSKGIRTQHRLDSITRIWNQEQRLEELLLDQSIIRQKPRRMNHTLLDP